MLLLLQGYVDRAGRRGKRSAVTNLAVETRMSESHCGSLYDTG